MRATATYRKLMRAIRKMPSGRRSEAVVICKSEFRDNAHLGEGDQLEEAFAKAEKSLDYVKMLTPPSRGKRAGKAGTYVMRDGKLVLEEAIEREFHMRPMKDLRVSDGDYKRHYDLVKRQHFMGPQRRR